MPLARSCKSLGPTTRFTSVRARNGSSRIVGRPVLVCSGPEPRSRSRALLGARAAFLVLRVPPVCRPLARVLSGVFRPRRACLTPPRMPPVPFPYFRSRFLDCLDLPRAALPARRLRPALGREGRRFLGELLLRRPPARRGICPGRRRRLSRPRVGPCPPTPCPGLLRRYRRRLLRAGLKRRCRRWRRRPSRRCRRRIHRRPPLRVHPWPSLHDPSVTSPLFPGPPRV